jgi:nucleoside-diphosphate-sugar epimerase
MRVLVTGGTGFVGGHTVKALVDAGHEPQLLVRSEEKLRRLVELFDLPPQIPFVEGDILDRASVDAAIEGADACVHAAAFTTLDPALMDQCLAINGPGTRIVLDAAVAAGCDPIIHTSSVSCIYPTTGDRFDADDPVRSGEAPYSRSKAESDLYARELQDGGHPVVILYLGGVTGPDDLGLNAAAAFLSALLASDTQMRAETGGGGAIDVRDVGAAITGLMRPGDGPRRFCAVGHALEWDEMNALQNAVSGYPRTGVTMTREQLLAAVPEEEAVEIMLGFRPGNDEPLMHASGVRWRPIEDTYRDTIVWMLTHGYLDPKWAPALAPSAS